MLVWLVSPTDGTRVPVRLLLDTGSNNSFVVRKDSLKRFMKLLGKEQIVLQSFGKASDCKVRDIFQAHIATSSHALPSESFYNLQLISVNYITCPIVSHKLTPYQSDYVDSHHLILADPEASEGNPLDIDILVGQDFYHDLVKGEKQHLSDGLVFIPTVGGYALGGRVNPSSDKPDVKQTNMTISTVNYISAFKVLPRDEEIQDMKQFISLDNLGIGPLDEETSPVQDRFNATTRHNGERYTAVLPKRFHRLKKLPSNFLLSYNRLLSSYKRLTKPGKENDLKAYSDIIKEQLESGVLEKVG